MTSLDMIVERREDGVWCVLAPWLEGHVEGKTWFEAYWAAMRVKAGARK